MKGPDLTDNSLVDTLPMISLKESTIVNKEVNSMKSVVFTAISKVHDNKMVYMKKYVCQEVRSTEITGHLMRKIEGIMFNLQYVYS